MSKILVVSIKPEFAYRILDGTKTIELRKSSPNVNNGDWMIIYSTSPEMAIIGVCKIKKVIKSTPRMMWRDYSEVLGIDENRFFEYYSGSPSSVGIVLERVKKLKVKITLKKIREYIPSFSPPQTFRYYNRNIITSTIQLQGDKDNIVF